MSTEEPPQFSEEELRQIEAEMQRISVDDVLLQTLVTLLNLGARKGGLGAAPGEAEPPPAPDLDQVRLAIEGARALMPLLEARHGDQLAPIRDALSRLQMFYARSAGGPAAEPAPGAPEAPEQRGGSGPAQSSGKLWVPGQ